MADNKVCSKCGEAKPLEQFSSYVDPRRKHLGPRPRADCKMCRSKRAQDWAKKNPQRHNENMAAYYQRGREEIRKRRRMDAYGLTEDEHDQIVAVGVCFICGTPADDFPGANTEHSQLHIDHDHKTGAVRGRLCHHCNHGLGNFADSEELLLQAIKYLKGKTWQRNAPSAPRRNLRSPRKLSRSSKRSRSRSTR